MGVYFLIGIILGPILLAFGICIFLASTWGIDVHADRPDSGRLMGWKETVFGHAKRLYAPENQTWAVMYWGGWLLMIAGAIVMIVFLAVL